MTQKTRENTTTHLQYVSEYIIQRKTQNYKTYFKPLVKYIKDTTMKSINTYLAANVNAITKLKTIEETHQEQCPTQPH